MHVIGLRRNPSQSENDDLLDSCVGIEGVGELMAKSDYVLVAAPLTKDTLGLVKEEHFAVSKVGQVLINGKEQLINLGNFRIIC
jgi:phosphoglycerate dehydrogenase-like enzyme